MLACVFVLGGRLPAVAAEHVLEVFVLDELTPVPTAGGLVLGVAAVRGAILPVLDVAPVVGATPRTPRSGDSLLRVGLGELQAALLAEKVLGVREIPVTAGAGGGLVLGRAGSPDGEVVVLDLPALFDRARA